MRQHTYVAFELLSAAIVFMRYTQMANEDYFYLLSKGSPPKSNLQNQTCVAEGLGRPFQGNPRSTTFCSNDIVKFPGAAAEGLGVPEPPWRHYTPPTDPESPWRYHTLPTDPEPHWRYHALPTDPESLWRHHTPHTGPHNPLGDNTLPSQAPTTLL